MHTKSKSKMPHTRKIIHKATSVNETYNNIHGQTEVMQSSIDTEKEKDNVIAEEALKETTKDDTNDEDGSSTSLDGLTFHDVGPENDLQSLASPVGNTSGRGAAPSINPIEFLRVLSELSSQRTRSHSRSHGKYKSSASIKYDRHFSLGSIPEGEIVTSYNKVEGSQVFDDDFLYNLMPFAFDSSHFQGTEEPPADEPPPSTPIERSTPSVKLAWDDSAPQTPDKSHVSPTNSVRKLSSSVPLRVKPTKKPLESSNKTPLKTSVCEFGGKISYTQNYK